MAPRSVPPHGDPEDPGPVKRKPLVPAPKNPPKPPVEPLGKVPAKPYVVTEEWESKDMGPGNTRPGYQLGDDIAKYDWWKANVLDPKWADAYGPSYQAFEWFAYKTKMNATSAGIDHYTDTLLRKNWTGVGIPGGFSSGGGGGGHGGGGGGGSAANTEQQIANAAASIKNEARKMGLDLDDDAINSLAGVVVNNNWSADMLNEYLAGGAATGTDVKAGTFTSSVDAVKAVAASQLMPISDSSAREWAGRIASGEMDMDGLRSMVANMARMKYTWAQPVIDSGVTMSDFLKPSRDRVASELELNADSVNLLDPRWQSMMYVTDDKGLTRAATDSEIVAKARRQPEYQRTKAAGDNMAGLATFLSNKFEGRG